MPKRPLSTSSSALLLAALVSASACAPSSTTDGSAAGAGDNAGNDANAVKICASGATLKGVDVSVYQANVDWAKVKGAGISFAFARVSDGLKSPDKDFGTNWSGIQAQGLVRGVYQYFRASQSAVQQADYLVSQIGGSLQPNDLPPVIDVETNDGVSTAAVVKGVAAWLAEIKAKTGVDGIVYTAAGLWNPLPGTSQFAKNPLWVANYGVTCPTMPSTWKQWAFWQNSEAGSVAGIAGHVDVDEFNGTLAQLQALTVQGTTGGCTGNADCASGQICDTTQSPAACVTAPPPAGCTSDADCASGQTCDTTQSPAVCVSSPPPAGCTSDADCPSGDTCNLAQSPPACIKAQSACPVLKFPSGISIQTVPDAAMTASYANHLQAGQSAPQCFLDVTHLVDPVASTTYDMTVHVATNFQLSELVGTEVSQGWGNFVLLDPAAVASLETFRQEVGVAMTINSGFRGPKHQEATCKSLCGAISCPGTCALYSEHMWGNAFDLPTTFYNTTDTKLACQAGFKFTYLESGTHLHIDQNPAYATCVMQ